MIFFDTSAARCSHRANEQRKKARFKPPVSCQVKNWNKDCKDFGFGLNSQEPPIAGYRRFPAGSKQARKIATALRQASFRWIYSQESSDDARIALRLPEKNPLVNPACPCCNFSLDRTRVPVGLQSPRSGFPPYRFFDTPVSANRQNENPNRRSLQPSSSFHPN